MRYLAYFDSKIALYTIMCLYILCSIQQYPEIYYYHDNKIIFITIMKLLSRLSIYLNYLSI